MNNKVKIETTKIVIGDGKYTIHHENGTNLRCLRYGQYWRDLVGDGMVLAMAQDIESLRERVQELETEAKVRQQG